MFRNILLQFLCNSCKVVTEVYLRPQISMMEHFESALNIPLGCSQMVFELASQRKEIR